MKTYEIPITWAYKRINVEAENLQEATEKAVKQFLNEHDDQYVDGTRKIELIIFDEYKVEDLDMAKVINSLE